MLFLLAVWTGLEPATPCVTGMYSNQLNYQTNILQFLLKNVVFSDLVNSIINCCFCCGGLDGTRTRDPMRDRHVF